jgi:hypothetical protein
MSQLNSSTQFVKTNCRSPEIEFVSSSIGRTNSLGANWRGPGRPRRNELNRHRAAMARERCDTAPVADTQLPNAGSCDQPEGATDMTAIHELSRERRRRAAAAELGLGPDLTPLPPRAALDRARSAADVLDAESGGHRDAVEVTSALAAVASAEAAERSAAALESIAAALTRLAEVAER